MNLRSVTKTGGGGHEPAEPFGQGNFPALRAAFFRHPYVASLERLRTLRDTVIRDESGRERGILKPGKKEKHEVRLAFKTAWRAEWNDLRAHVLSISRHFYEFRPGFLSLLSLSI